MININKLKILLFIATLFAGCSTNKILTDNQIKASLDPKTLSSYSSVEEERAKELNPVMDSVAQNMFLNQMER